MFELLVALKYLVPRKKQLSVSVISLISALVISLVVWLILVFFSVTNGLEKSWVQKLVSLTAPVRITPTDAYYDSYYYRIDSLAEASNYSSKSLREKLAASTADPYDPDSDEEIPPFWPAKDHDAHGRLKDLAREAVLAAEEAGANAAPFETSVATLRLNLKREGEKLSSMSQSAYLASLDPSNKDIHTSLLEPTVDDVDNLARQGYSLEGAAITALTPLHPYRIPEELLPKEGSATVVVVRKGDKALYAYLPATSGEVDSLAQILESQWKSWGAQVEKNPIDFSLPLYLPQGALLSVASEQEGVFQIDAQFQDVRLKGPVSLDGLKVAACKGCKKPDTHLKPLASAEAIFLPKPFREAGVRAGDEGVIAYTMPTTSTMQEQRIPVVVRGFYDQGIVPIGGRLVMARPELVANVMNAYDAAESSLMSGIDVRFEDFERADEVKSRILASLEERGVAPYWHVETFREYAFTKDLLQQLRSEKNLFSLISVVIIIVACSNIISMLIILVNDKKVEIGILRSMGASSLSIAAIFAFCGLTMGLAGSLLGLVLALLTLSNLDALVSLISFIQGHELFNSHFFGEVIPNELSGEALSFVITATVMLSLISGIVPALKACMLKPSQILRADG